MVAVPPVEAAPAAAPAIAAFFDDGNFLGVVVEEVTRENMGGYGLTGEPRGVAVTRVVKDGPAERAGLRERDVIVRFDGEQVTSVRKLNRLIGESAPGHGARLTIRRGGSEQELTVTLGKRESFMRTFEGLQNIMPLEAEARRRAEESRAQGEEARRRADELRGRSEELRRQAEEWQRANPGGVYAYALRRGAPHRRLDDDARQTARGLLRRLERRARQRGRREQPRGEGRAEGGRHHHRGGGREGG